MNESRQERKERGERKTGGRWGKRQKIKEKYTVLFKIEARKVKIRGRNYRSGRTEEAHRWD